MELDNLCLKTTGNFILKVGMLRISAGFKIFYFETWMITKVLLLNIEMYHVFKSFLGLI